LGGASKKRDAVPDIQIDAAKAERMIAQKLRDDLVYDRGRDLPAAVADPRNY
jgi:hypothetical protein